MLIIKRLSDGAHVGSVASTMTAQEEMELNVIPNFGGVAKDYVAEEMEPQIDIIEDQPTTEDRLSALEAVVLDLMGV